MYSERNNVPLFVGCCVLLGIAEYTLYHVNFHHFFQGDAIFWMYYRFRSVGEFLRGLVTLDVAHWYRPLSNRTIPSLLYPWLGLRPHGYHLVVFASFFVTTCLVFGFFKSLTGRLSTAFLAAFYFSIHSIDFYTTYDFAFSPEVFYVFFYVCAVWFFLLGERADSRIWRTASVVCCVLTLMSKEAAVTIPATLFATHLLFIRKGFLRAVKAIAAPFAVWIVYLIYIVWYLGVGGGDYMLIVHTNIARNLVTGIFYALNLRHDGWLPTRVAPQFVFVFLVAFAVALAIMVARLFLLRRERTPIVFGALWFVIGLAPMLMLNVMGPYYAFLALVGFALIVGVSLNHVADSLAAYSRWGARAVLGAALVMFWVSAHSVLATDTAADTAMGFASKWAETSATDMLAARPQLPPGTRIYVLNESVPDLWRFQGIGNLFKVVYRDDSITTAYRSRGEGPKTGTGELVVMNVEGNHLIDVTAAFKADPEKFIPGVDETQFKYIAPPGVRLSVDPTEVVAGRDFYWLTAEGIGSDLVVQYTFDDGPVAEARFKLSPEGKVRFFITDFTPIGVFHFIRFRAFASPATEWIRADARLRVLPPQSRQH